MDTVSELNRQIKHLENQNNELSKALGLAQTQIDILQFVNEQKTNALIDIVNDYQDLQEYGKFTQVLHHVSQASINRAKQALGIELTNISFIHRNDVK